MARNTLVAGLLACVLLTFLAPAQAQDSRQYHLNMQVLPLWKAVGEFFRQTGVNIVYVPISDQEQNTLVGPLKGRYTVHEALTELLKPAGVTYKWTDERTVAVVSLPPKPQSSAGVNTAGVAAKDHPRAGLSEEQKRAMAAGGESSGSAYGPDMLEGIIVTGTRLWHGFNLPAPVTVFDREKIEDLGVSTVADLLKYVPQQPYLRTEAARQDGAQFAEMRGLGADTTLVLVNGRRTGPSATTAVTFNAFDLNSIPLPAVERVEVLADSASAVYGADAVGGVINIILKRDIPYPRADISYGTADGGAAERRASLSLGDSVGALRGSVVLDYFDRDILLGEERDRWRNQDYRRFGSTDLRSPAASPGNISSLTSENLPGLPSPIAAVPVGSTGIGLTPADFLATAGQRNLESVSRFRSILPESERLSGVAQGEVTFRPDVSAFGELLYVEATHLGTVEPSVLAGIVPATNPFNPFDVPVLATFRLEGVGAKRLATESDLLRAVAGLRGNRGEWDWELSLLKSSDDAESSLDDVDPMRVQAALMALEPDQSLNVFRDGPRGSPHLMASLMAEPAVSRFSSDSTQALAFLNGNLFPMPSGDVGVVMGGEWRKEHLLYNVASQLGLPMPLSGSHDRTVSAAFAELRLPLVDSRARVAAVNELTLTLAARFDDYSDAGGRFSPQYALIWRPITDVSVRMSFSEGFRPPSLFELFMPPLAVGGVPVVDPRRNEVGSATIVAGGNPDLEPVRAETVTAGITFSPRALPLTLAATYWQIEMKDKVGVLAHDALLANEASFPDRIIRDEPSPADIVAGQPGPLRRIDITRLNFGSVETSGLDLSAAYELDTGIGRFASSLSATWVHEFTDTDMWSALRRDRVGLRNVLGTVPRMRAVANMNWTRHGVGLSATARYLSSYEDTIVSERTGRIVPSQWLVDAQASLSLDEFVGEGSPWGGFEIRAGVSNLFDEEPPFTEGEFGYDITQGELKRRFGYIKISKSF